MTTYSDSLKLTLIGDGEQSGTWGQTTNTNLGTLLEQAITGVVSITMANADYPLSDYNGASDEARNAVIIAGGTVSTDSPLKSIVAPSQKKLYVIKNATTDGGTGVFPIGIKTSSGAALLIPNGVTVAVYCDGTNFYPQAVNTISNQTVNGNLAATGTLSVTGASTFGGDGTFSGTGQIKLPAGTTGQRTGSPANGMIRFNNTSNQFEGYANGNWGTIGGGAQAGGAIVINNTTVSSSYTISSGQNGLSVGPMTIDTGVTVTIESGQRWLVL